MYTTKKSLALSVIFCLGLMTSSIKPELSLPSLTSCYEGEDSGFKLLEFIFVEQPKNMLTSIGQTAQTSIVAVITTGVLYSAFTSESKENRSIWNHIPKLAAGVLGKMVVYDTYMNYQEKIVKRAILKKFLKNWSFYRNQIPAQLTSAFDELAKRKNISDADISEIYSVVQHLIEHEFTKRYEKDKMKSPDFLTTFKTYTDISKNLG